MLNIKIEIEIEIEMEMVNPNRIQVPTVSHPTIIYYYNIIPMTLFIILLCGVFDIPSHRRIVLGIT